MKRSAFENPHVLAKEIGGELSNWKLPRGSMNDYASAPRLRSISKGETLFRTRCAACHTVGRGIGLGQLGPDLLGVTQRRARAWLERWLFDPDKMLEERDPIALQLYEEYGQLPMPNSRLNQVEVDSLIRFLEDESRRLEEPSATSGG
jgi:protein SCO1/2